MKNGCSRKRVNLTAKIRKSSRISQSAWFDHRSVFEDYGSLETRRNYFGMKWLWQGFSKASSLAYTVSIRLFKPTHLSTYLSYLFGYFFKSNGWMRSSDNRYKIRIMSQSLQCISYGNSSVWLHTYLVPLPTILVCNPYTIFNWIHVCMCWKGQKTTRGCLDWIGQQLNG